MEMAGSHTTELVSVTLALMLCIPPPVLFAELALNVL